MTNPAPSDSSLPIDVVEVVIDNDAQMDDALTESRPIGDIDDEIELVFDLSEDASSVAGGQDEEEHLRSEMRVLSRTLQNLIDCQVSDEIKANLRDELNELRRKFELFMNHFKQDQVPAHSNITVLKLLKLVYDDGREELVRPGRSMDANESGDRIGSAANLLSQATNTPVESSTGSARSQNQFGPSKPRPTKRPIQSTSYWASIFDKRAKLDENNNRMSSADRTVCSEDNDLDDDSIKLLSSDEELEEQPRSESFGGSTTSYAKQTGASQSSSASGTVNTAVSSNQQAMSSGRRLTRYKPLASSSETSESSYSSYFEDLKDGFIIIDESRSTERRSSERSATDDDLEAEQLTPNKRKKSDRSKEPVNYKDPSSSSVSSEWSTSGSECYRDPVRYNKRKEELKLQKWKKLERMKSCFTVENRARHDPNYSPRSRRRSRDKSSSAGSQASFT